ncbi:MAG: NifB/NifX family molybdenum-iron cluster-binding protein [Bacillota bacterium]|jgi:predicted Fe-Mo cluster-binding NifX family protein
MKLALAVFEDRISVIFDNSKQLQIVLIEDNLLKNRKEVYFNTLCIVKMIEMLKEESVEIIICGAISEYMQNIIERNGIKVIPWISGSVQNVLDAWMNGTLEKLVMPGCCRLYAKKFVRSNLK